MKKKNENKIGSDTFQCQFGINFLATSEPKRHEQIVINFTYFVVDAMQQDLHEWLTSPTPNENNRTERAIDNANRVQDENSIAANASIPMTILSRPFARQTTIPNSMKTRHVRLIRGDFCRRLLPKKLKRKRINAV